VEKIEYKIGIIGSGKMGSDIFNYLSDFNLRIYWVVNRSVSSEDIYSKYKRKIDRDLKNGLITEEEYKRKSNNIIISKDFDILKDCNLIIEAISENIELKIQLFESLNKYVNADCIFATNSSSIKPGNISVISGKKQKFIGLHYFYPLKYKDIVEFIINNDTSQKTIDFVSGFLKFTKKFYLIQNEDFGFILNRLFFEIQAEAYNIFEESIYSVEEIDEIVKVELFPIGAFELIDNVGIDTIYYSMSEYIKDYEDKKKYLPLISTLKFMLESGCQGKKNNNGFYDYSNESFKINQLKKGNIEFSKEEIKDRIENSYKNFIIKLLNNNQFKKNELEYAINQFLGI
jgi:3-hydroxybutyryl-CoA dehydrogenase